MGNNWWEIDILCTPVLEDMVFWRLEKFGCNGISSEVKKSSHLIRAYLPQADVQLLDLAALSLWLRQDALELEFPAPLTQWHLIDEEDWSSSWKQHWEPQDIGDRFVIYPAWYAVPSNLDRTVIRIDPGAAFGTGVHPTTQLCLEALEMRFYDPETQGCAIADVGCGSGILSIGALKLGAGQLYSVDLDSLAIRATEQNRELNEIDPNRLIVEKGSVGQILGMTSDSVDGIMCNILAEVIIELIPQMSAIAHSKTWAIFSGILLEQAGMIAGHLEKNDWVVATLWKRGEWCCFNARRS